MITWNNLDTVSSYKELEAVAKVNLAEVMSGENGAERVRKYSAPMAEGMAFNYASRPVDDTVLAALAKLAEETQLTEKFAALYNGEMINTGEKRLVLHHMCRGQLGDAVIADGSDKREFYTGEQKKIAEFANTNIGTRPTVEGHHITVEPWILDFDADLYGKPLTLEFHKFLRPEQKFSDLAALQAEIRKNGAETRNFFGKM